MNIAFSEIEKGIEAALETYSNVHRGSGHSSLVSTHLFEQAREIVLEYLGLDRKKYVVIFCTPRRAAALTAKLKTGSYKVVSSLDLGLPLSVRAVAVKRDELPKGAPSETGGGTTRIVSRNWVMWGKAPDKFEAGTPAIINIIAFARALKLIGTSGNKVSADTDTENLIVADILYNDELDEYTGSELLEKLRQTLIGRDILVPTTEGPGPFINFDNGASTPTFTPVWNAFCKAWRQPLQQQQEIIEESKNICAAFLGAPRADYEVIFTSNTTEAINLAAESFGRGSEPGTEPVVLNTMLEHTSNDLPWRMIPGVSLIRLQIDNEGFIDLTEMETSLRAYNQEGKYGNKRIRLVAVSGASNVLGTFNDLAGISRIVHQYGARLLVDGAQMVAHRKADMKSQGIDYLAFSGHKMYATFGTGALVARKGLLNFSPAEQELINLSGEENVGGIAALGKALVLLQRIGMDRVQQEEQELTGKAIRGLSKIPGLKIYGITDPASKRFAQKGGVIVFSLKGIISNKLDKELAERGGIGVRSGCHCAHILIKHLLGVSPSLERFQGLILTVFPKLNLPGLLRVSFGLENTQEEVDKLIAVLSKIKEKPKAEIKIQMNDFVLKAAQKVYGG